MEKVIRICEITGKVTTIADNLTTAQAQALIIKEAKADPFGDYRRVAKTF
jgi:hypothetical protein